MPNPRTLESLLQEYFGHDEFRSGQRQVMETLLEGRPSLAVFPTGGGKSLCYQLPALLLDGVTLVISPLIALMKDQVEALLERGIAAARLDSTLEAEEVREIYEQVSEGSLKLLYIAPERLANEGFLEKLRQTKISLMAIDEAHCISEWGHNFRPDYLKLGRQAKELKAERVLALTATATPKVSKDIREHFGITKEDHVQTGFRRDNLRYVVTPSADRKELLAKRLSEREPGATIVYVTLQHTAEQVAGFLERDKGFNAKAYHAGLPAEYRAEVQNRFMAGEIDIVVATIAFGMGIDKSDIRYVYHYNLPKSLENFAQETGRAGRDGEDSLCEILACADDQTVLENFVYGDTPTPQALKQLVEHLLLQGEQFSVSRYELSGTNDIRPLVVATVLTHLELTDVLIPTGPFYASYKFQFHQPIDRILAGYSPERKDLLGKVFAAAKKARKWNTVDIAATANRIGEPADEIQKALNHLAELGDLEIQPSGLRHGYKLNPGNPLTLGQITAELQELFQVRERGEVARLGMVLELCETAGCLPKHLVNYFGEEMEPCGICGNCVEKASETKELPCTIIDEISLEDVEVMREVMAEKKIALRQPRQLARFLCGISSPAATRARLSRHDHFGALERVPFLSVLAHLETMSF